MFNSWEITMKHLPRDHQRAYITFYLRVYEENNFIGFMAEISQEGMKILSDFQLKINKFYNLKMKLPSSLEWKDKKNIDDRFINFSAECLWSNHDKVNKDFYISGFRISDFSDEDNEIIHTMIEQYRIP